MRLGSPKRPNSPLAGVALAGLLASVLQFAGPIGHWLWATAEHSSLDAVHVCEPSTHQSSHGRPHCGVCRTFSSSRPVPLPYRAADVLPPMPGEAAYAVVSRVWASAARCGPSSRAPPALS